MQEGKIAVSWLFDLMGCMRVGFIAAAMALKLTNAANSSLSLKRSLQSASEFEMHAEGLHN